MFGKEFNIGIILGSLIGSIIRGLYTGDYIPYFTIGWICGVGVGHIFKFLIEKIKYRK